MEPMRSNYKSKKKCEYRRRKRNKERMNSAKQDENDFITEPAMPSPQQPVNEDHDEITSQCSSSASDLQAELDAVGLWRPEDDQEMAHSLPSSVSLPQIKVFSRFVIYIDNKIQYNMQAEHFSSVNLVENVNALQLLQHNIAS